MPSETDVFAFFSNGRFDKVLSWVQRDCRNRLSCASHRGNVALSTASRRNVAPRLGTRAIYEELLACAVGIVFAMNDAVGMLINEHQGSPDRCRFSFCPQYGQAGLGE
jgi:hypothetical protein